MARKCLVGLRLMKLANRYLRLIRDYPAGANKEHQAAIVRYEVDPKSCVKHSSSPHNSQFTSSCFTNNFLHPTHHPFQLSSIKSTSSYYHCQPFRRSLHQIDSAHLCHLSPVIALVSFHELPISCKRQDISKTLLAVGPKLMIAKSESAPALGPLTNHEAPFACLTRAGQFATATLRLEAVPQSSDFANRPFVGLQK